ncbi:PKD domain-containing protein [Candidatus Bipolaricaulota bacterium]|nr:PKD domain-containing protein [Candidatus Bipolaricaulota bacterium]
MKRQKMVGLLATLSLVAVSISGCLQLQSTDPQALFTASQIAHIIPFTASFDGTLTYTPAGEIVSYLWTFGDGASDTGPVVDHVYQQNGTYTVTLTVFDADGQSASTSLTVEALNPLPTAEFSYTPRSTMEEQPVVSASEEITFDGAESFDDEEVVSYEWYFGDTETATGQVVKHKYLYPGEYNVVLTVTDNDGGTTQCVQQVKVIGGTPCNADITEGAPWSCQ